MQLISALPLYLSYFLSKPLDRWSLENPLPQDYSDGTTASGHSRRPSLIFQRKANPHLLGSSSAMYPEALRIKPLIPYYHKGAK